MIVTHKPYGQPWHTFVTVAWQGDKTARNIFLASCSVAENALRALYDMLEACDEPTTQARIFGILVEGLQDLSVALPRSLQVLNEFDISLYCSLYCKWRCFGFDGLLSLGNYHQVG